MKAFAVPPDAAGARLDQWLAGQTQPDLSRSRVQQLIRDGRVHVSGRVVTQPNHRVAADDRVELQIPEPDDPEPLGEDIPLSILHEDPDLIVIDKPAGLVVHPGPGNWTGTLVNALVHHCGASLSGIGGVRRPGIVHRLDKETSGVLVVAKTDIAHRVLSEAFADHGRSGDLERAYTAIVWGVPERRQGTIEASLGRSTRDRTLRAVVRDDREDARHAVTHYSVTAAYGATSHGTAMASRIDCRLETGRTHQIRVHLAHLGHPLIGDADYARAFRTKSARLPEDVRVVVDGFGRQALHARLLAFTHPVTGKAMRFETPPPEDLSELIAALTTL